MIRSAFLILALISIGLRAGAQTWEVPEDKISRVSPFKFSNETAKKGEAVFIKNCTSCHGMPTKRNFANLVPSPGDPASDKFQKQPDGAIFYKITTGKGLMPQFKDIVSEEDVWNIISYVRSFNKSYEQPSIEAAKLFATSAKALFAISVLEKEKKIKIVATDTLNKPLKGLEISLFAKRYFGNMPLGEPTLTNDMGAAFFEIPKKLPGDKNGMVEVIARQSSGDYKKTEMLAIGVPTLVPPLTQPRAMWNVGKKAPLWLMLSYSGVVLAVWAFLIYIVLQIIKIRRAGVAPKNE